MSNEETNRQETIIAHLRHHWAGGSFFCTSHDPAYAARMTENEILQNWAMLSPAPLPKIMCILFREDDTVIVACEKKDLQYYVTSDTAYYHEVRLDTANRVVYDPCEEFATGAAT